MLVLLVLVLLRMRPRVGTRIKLLIVTTTYRHAGSPEAAREPSRGMCPVAKASYLVRSRGWRKRPGQGLIDVIIGRRG